MKYCTSTIYNFLCASIELDNYIRLKISTDLQLNQVFGHYQQLHLFTIPNHSIPNHNNYIYLPYRIILYRIIPISNHTLGAICWLLLYNYLSLSCTELTPSLQQVSSCRHSCMSMQQFVSTWFCLQFPLSVEEMHKNSVPSSSHNQKSTSIT